MCKQKLIDGAKIVNKVKGLYERALSCSMCLVKSCGI